MAIGLNIDFASLLSNFDPKIYVGGVMTGIWGPISWTVIFGLSFATFLTLIIVPVMYRITTVIQKKAIILIGNQKQAWEIGLMIRNSFEKAGWISDKLNRQQVTSCL